MYNVCAARGFVHTDGLCMAGTHPQACADLSVDPGHNNYYMYMCIAFLWNLSLEV